jgi:hypothetical protein
VYRFAQLKLFLALLAACVSLAPAQEKAPDSTPTEAVFKSDIAMGRIDVQALDGDLRAIPNLTEDDFILKKGKDVIAIRNFSYQEMPVDIVLLLDVSGSMQPQVERVFSVSERALRVLAPQDRVAIMVFTTRARVRLKFSEDRDEIERRLDEIVRDSSFGGGTNINRALLDSAAYVTKEARREARRAIIIVTDDIAEPIDQQRTGAALSEADAVLMALLTPEALQHGRGPIGSPGGRFPGGGIPPILFPPWPGGGGRYPGGGGPRGPQWPGGPPPVGSPGPGRVPHAGTDETARASGGEGFPSGKADALETAFTRIRQQYSMHFYLPDGATAEDASAISVDLTNNARIRHADTELRYRQVFLSGNSRRTFVKRVRPAPATAADTQPGKTTVPTLTGRRRPTDEQTGPRVQVTPQKAPPGAPPTEPVDEDASQPKRRRPAISEPREPRVRTIP